MRCRWWFSSRPTIGTPSERSRCTRSITSSSRSILIDCVRRSITRHRHCRCDMQCHWPIDSKDCSAKRGGRYATEALRLLPYRSTLPCTMRTTASRCWTSTISSGSRASAITSTSTAAAGHISCGRPWIASRNGSRRENGSSASDALRSSMSERLHRSSATENLRSSFTCGAAPPSSPVATINRRFVVSCTTAGRRRRARAGRMVICHESPNAGLHRAASSSSTVRRCPSGRPVNGFVQVAQNLPRTGRVALFERDHQQQRFASG